MMTWDVPPLAPALVIYHSLPYETLQSHPNFSKQVLNCSWIFTIKQESKSSLPNAVRLFRALLAWIQQVDNVYQYFSIFDLKQGPFCPDAECNVPMIARTYRGHRLLTSDWVLIDKTGYSCFLRNRIIQKIRILSVSWTLHQWLPIVGEFIVIQRCIQNWRYLRWGSLNVKM